MAEFPTALGAAVAAAAAAAAVAAVAIPQAVATAASPSAVPLDLLALLSPSFAVAQVTLDAISPLSHLACAVLLAHFYPAVLAAVYVSVVVPAVHLPLAVVVAYHQPFSAVAHVQLSVNVLFLLSSAAPFLFSTA